MARHLDIRGYCCRVLLLGSPEELQGDAAGNFAILRKTGLPTVELTVPAADHGRSTAEVWPADELREQLDLHGRDAAWIIDALLGTGARGEPRPPFDAAIAWINSRGPNTQVLAVDVPSGLDCDTGQPANHTVRADHTCTFAAMKTGFTQPAAKAFTGTIHVCDIGLPPRLIDKVLDRHRGPIQAW